MRIEMLSHVCFVSGDNGFRCVDLYMCNATAKISRGSTSIITADNVLKMNGQYLQSAQLCIPLPNRAACNYVNLKSRI